MSLAALNAEATRDTTQFRASDFYGMARLLVRAKGDHMQAAAMAESSRATPRVIGALKSAVAAGATVALSPLAAGPDRAGPRLSRTWTREPVLC